MKVSHLRRLRTLVEAMQLSAESFGWHARAIAKIVAEIDGDAAPEASTVARSPATEQECQSPAAETPSPPTTDGPNTTPPANPLADDSRNEIGSVSVRNVPRAPRPVNRRHPMFEDDPVAVAESERKHGGQTFSMRYGWR